MSLEAIIARTAARKAAGRIPDYRIKLRGRGAGSRTGLVVLPCLHLGGPARPPGDNPTAKRWQRCDHPGQPLGPRVCACNGCGPKCVGYEPDPQEIV